MGLPALMASACSAPVTWAPDEAVARAFVPQIGPAYLTLYTMKNTGSDQGAHTGLMINASQRVIFDPAGTFDVNVAPERNDVIFGVTPLIESFYASYHARETYYVVMKKVYVSDAVADQAMRLAMAAGPIPKANCTRATSGILRQLPGFEGIRQTYFPDNLEAAFDKLSGVETTVLRESDSDDKDLAARQFEAAMQAGADAREAATLAGQ